MRFTRPLEFSSGYLCEHSSSVTPKQYHSRRSFLTIAGLIQKERGRHTLNSLDKIVYVVRNSGYDCIESFDELTWDYNKIIDTLIDNRNIKDILLSIHSKEELVITTSE